MAVIENVAGSGLYYQLNFNDTYSGMLTLFSILVSNNWNAVAEMYCAICANNWPKVYFSSFFVIMIMVILNIVVSFVLEIYNISLAKSKEKLNKINNAKAILKVAPTQESLEELIKKAQLYDQFVGNLSVSSTSSTGESPGTASSPRKSGGRPVSLKIKSSLDDEKDKNDQDSDKDGQMSPPTSSDKKL
jgi:general stress protein CsbA